MSGTTLNTTGRAKFVHTKHDALPVVGLSCLHYRRGAGSVSVTPIPAPALADAAWLLSRALLLLRCPSHQGSVLLALYS